MLHKIHSMKKKLSYNFIDLVKKMFDNFLYKKLFCLIELYNKHFSQVMELHEKQFLSTLVAFQNKYISYWLLH